MKRCPECRRDYYDETLLYCLDDGNALLEGPATADEPATAILSEPGAIATGFRPDEAPTRHLVNPPERAPVLPSESPPVASSKENVISQVKQYKLWTLLISVIVVAGVGLGIYKLTGSKKTNISFESAKITRITNSGRVLAAAISPDGKWLVYANDDGEQKSLWLQQVAIAGSSTQIPLPSADQIWGLVFSPDGRYVFYTAIDYVSSKSTHLYQVPVLGGTVRKLLTDIWGKVSFSPDGKHFTYHNFDGDEDRLMIANADGTGQRQLAARRGNEFFFDSISYGTSWSPDGKTIVTTVGTVNPLNMSVAAVSVETGEITSFTSQKFRWAGDVTWLADGKSVLLLAGERFGTGSIWQISYPSGEAEKISNDSHGYSGFSLTADSNVLVALQGTNNPQGTTSWAMPTGITNIWTAPLSDTGRASQLTSGSDRNFSPSWTPDGKIVYVKDSGGSVDLHMVDQRGGTPRQLTVNSGSNFNPSVSPDGRFIVFTSDRSGTPSLWRTDIDGSNPKQLTSNLDSTPSISPDGREVIYTSVNNGLNFVWKVGIDGGEPTQLTDMESNWPIYSPDGKHFVCSYHGDPTSWWRMAIVSSSGGTPVKTFTQPSGFTLNAQWMPDGRSIVYGINKGGVTNLWAQPIDGGPPRQITNFTSDLIQSFDFSRDGKQIAFTRRTGTSDVVLISGFRK